MAVAKEKKHHHRRPRLQVEEEVTPNLIPMVDIMFLLLLFLMLGADMGQREFEDVILPVVDGVKEDKEPDKKGVTTVNVYHDTPREQVCLAYKSGGVCIEESHWKIGIRGRDFNASSIGTMIKSEADLGRAKGAILSERRVMIRADQAALYKYVQAVIDACAHAGLYKVEIGAAERMGNA